jgi:PIN domain nuclease of toxin-antitoxin system
VFQAVIDTHAVIWYLYADGRLSITARNAIEQIAADGNQIAISSITLAEIVYLSERGRIHSETLDRLLRAMDDARSLFVECPFDRHIVQAMRNIDRLQVPELPDRIIAASALHLGVPVISRDHRIQQSALQTIGEINWDA